MPLSTSLTTFNTLMFRYSFTNMVVIQGLYRIRVPQQMWVGVDSIIYF